MHRSNHPVARSPRRKIRARGRLSLLPRRTANGRAFLNTLGGAAGDEIADDYAYILEQTGVPVSPELAFANTGVAGLESSPVGIRVDDTKLLNLSAYMDSLQAPAGAEQDAQAVVNGRALFRETCTSCHNVDQGRFVPSMLIPMADIFPGDDPVELAVRVPPLNSVLNTVDSIFDDKMAVVNATLRGDIRGIALPLLLDLARKPVFLHDNSVPTLEALLDPARGPLEPHPFYVDNADDRSDVVAFLKSLSTN